MEFTTQLQAYRVRIENGIENLVPLASTRPARLHAPRPRPRPRAPPPSARGRGHLPPPAPCRAPPPGRKTDAPGRAPPPCHKKFDEATALLPGDALLTSPFQLVARHYAVTPTL